MEQNRSLRIFVFDDDPSITRLFDLVLSAKGHSVHTFHDPSFCKVYQDQHQCLQDFPCADVIITDIMMPKMNGIELLRRQRDRGCSLPSANKALMSAKIDAEQKEAVKELGCHFIRKPFRLADVNEWIEGCIDRIINDRQLDKVATKN